MAREESRGKRPFKIWDGFRNTRKSLVASSLKDLEIRGKEKLNISQNETVRLVLEMDGTHIEDPEYFKTLPNNTTVLLLRNDECWYPAGVDAIKTAIAAIPKIVCETIHALELQNETPSWKIMDNKGRVTVVLHWDQRTQNYRSSSHGGIDASPSKRTTQQQNGFGAGGLLMENTGNGKREPAEPFYQYHQPAPTAYRHGSTPQITVIHHDAMPMVDRLGGQYHHQSPQQQARRLSKQGSSSMDTAAIHVHTAECAQPARHPASNNGSGTSLSSSPRAGSPAMHDGLTATVGGGLSSAAQGSAAATADNGFECDFHCCALHEEGRRIAVHKSVATSPIQECHHSVAQTVAQQQQQQQPASSSLSDGSRRASPKGHVRFLDAAGSPPLPPPPLLPPPAPIHHSSAGGSTAGRKQQQQQQQQQLPHQPRSDESSESETETTVIEDDSMTSDKFLLLIDQLTGKQDKHLTVKDIGVILERLNSKIVDVERLDREYEATDCYNWTIKATIRGDVLQELGIIYNGSYYGISEHPGYRQHNGEAANEEDDEEAIDDDDDDDDRRRHADEEVNI